MLRNEKGFTLIELIMIIIILGILAAIAVPRYVDLQADARNAVLDASVGAIKSAAIIQYAARRPNPAANTLASIIAQTDLDNAVLSTPISPTTCNNANTLTITHSGGGTRTFSIQSIYCSG